MRAGDDLAMANGQIGLKYTVEKAVECRYISPDELNLGGQKDTFCLEYIT